MSRLSIRLYGGVNEIGGNKFLLEDGDGRLLLDFGASLGARGGYFEEFLKPRTNSVLRDFLRLRLLPDVDGVYREDFLTVARADTDKDLPESADAWRRRGGKPGVDGVLVTHAHVDHFQDLSFLDPAIPVYATRTTLAMIRAITAVSKPDVDKEVLTARIRSLGSLSGGAAFPGDPTVRTEDVPRTFVAVDEGVPFRVGAFEAVAVPVDHSVPGACAFLVKCPSGKRVFYSGDVRFHGRLEDRTSALLKAADGLAPDVMICEGTRMASHAQDNELDVERTVREHVQGATGLVAAEFAWKDTTRFDTLQRVAEATDRTLLVDARLAFLLRALDGHADVPSRGIEHYGNVRVFMRRRSDMLNAPSDYAKHEIGYRTDWTAKEMRAAKADGDAAFLADALAHHENGVRADAVRRNPDKFIVHLSFWSVQELFDLAPPDGSRWIRCLTEPFNDEMTLDLQRHVNWLDHFGLAHNVDPRPGRGDADGLLGGTTHVSGHGAGPDLEKLMKSARPTCLVPVHAEESSLDRFEDLRLNAHVFRGKTHRDAARGRLVVEP